MRVAAVALPGLAVGRAMPAVAAGCAGIAAADPSTGPGSTRSGRPEGASRVPPAASGTSRPAERS